LKSAGIVARFLLPAPDFHNTKQHTLLLTWYDYIYCSPEFLQMTWQSCANFCTVKGLLRLFWNLCSCFWGRLWGAARYPCHFYKFLTLWVLLQYSSCLLFSNSFSVCFSDSYHFGLWSWHGSLLWSTTRADHLMWKMCWFYWGFSPVGIACLRVSGEKK
jgi:hypothetical protein